MQTRHRKEAEVSAMKEESQLMQERFQDLLNQAKTDRDAKIQECEELRMQVNRIGINDNRFKRFFVDFLFQQFLEESDKQIKLRNQIVSAAIR